jgi:hypothetical protein
VKENMDCLALVVKVARALLSHAQNAVQPDTNAKVFPKMTSAPETWNVLLFQPASQYRAQ